MKHNLKDWFASVRDITGKTGSINFDGHFPLSGPFYKEESSNYKEAVISDTYYDRLNLFDISRSVPTSDENKPCSIVLMLLCRIIWDITGEFRFGDVVGSALEVSRTKGILSLYGSRENTLMYEYNDYYEGRYINLDSTYQVPGANENVPSSMHILLMIRLLWSSVIMLVR